MHRDFDIYNNSIYTHNNQFNQNQPQVINKQSRDKMQINNRWMTPLYPQPSSSFIQNNNQNILVNKGINTRSDRRLPVQSPYLQQQQHQMIWEPPAYNNNNDTYQNIKTNDNSYWNRNYQDIELMMPKQPVYENDETLRAKDTRRQHYDLTNNTRNIPNRLNNPPRR